MAITASEKRAIRRWTGRAPDDQALQDYLDGADGDPLGAALAILEERRADLISAPGKQGVDGDFSREITKHQLEQLDAQIGRLNAEMAATDDDPDTSSGLTVVSVGRLTRCGPGR